MLREMGLEDVEGAKEKGNMPGYIIATYGTDSPVMTEEEVKALKEWFEAGGGKTAAETETS